MNKNIISFLLLLFLSMNYAVYTLTQKNASNIIDNELEDSVYAIETHNDILLTVQKNISNSLYSSILENTNLRDTLTESYTTPQNNSHNRKNLYQQVLQQFKAAKEQGVIQVHFVDKNNISFLRMSDQNLFGDNFTNVRKDYMYVHQNQEITRGFSKGLTSAAFRNIYPIFDINKKYIGAMEISFSSDHFQWYLNHVSHLHSHFLVNKNLLNDYAWQKEEFEAKYSQSAESKNLMLSLNKIHTQESCIDKNQHRLHPIREEMNLNMKKGYDFATYISEGEHIVIVSFLPITNSDDDVLAWVVTYKPSSVIKTVLRNTFIIQMSTLLLSLLIIYFLIMQFNSKEEIQEQYSLFNKILNTTEDILLITDFKSIKFSNDKCNKLLSNTLDSISEKYSFDVVDLFLVKDGYLHKNLLENNESFISLLKRTNPEDRVVTLLDEFSEPKAYTIHTEVLEDNESYLVSLSDVTELKIALIETAKKAYIDKLTNVYNRHKFDELFQDELLRVQRYKQPLSIVLIDIDKFKTFNDTYGHLIGDEVLVTMAQNINKSVRDTDIFARWGGEEFVILFKETGAETAKTLSLKLKDIVEAAKHPIAGKVTGSFGLTQYVQGDTIDSMFKRCDKALYLAKENGRNRVEVL